MADGVTIFIGSVPSSPLGQIWVAVRQNQLIATAIDCSETRFRQMIGRLLDSAENNPPTPTYQKSTPQTNPFTHQIAEYLNGERKLFTMAIDWSVMKPFQIDALQIVDQIPYGKTRSYGEIARELGKPDASRAVGHANATNPIPIVVPCHRVVGSNGKLTGYNAPNGIETKEWLLHLEGNIQGRQMKLF